MSATLNYDYYEILECSIDSSYEDLKRAYHRLALIHHPDKTSTKEESSSKFLKIEEAWRTLSDAKLRKQYDADCRQMRLEQDSFIIYDIVPVESMKVEGDKELSYPCRCGGKYLLETDDISPNAQQFYLSCMECTLFIAIELVPGAVLGETFDSPQKPFWSNN